MTPPDIRSSEVRRDTLRTQYDWALEAVRTAVLALSKCEPSWGDYQKREPYRAAQREHALLVAALKRSESELTELRLHCE